MTKEEKQLYTDQLQEIQDFLYEEVDDHNTDLLVERLTKMNSYLAMVTELYPRLVEIQQADLQVAYQQNIEWIFKAPATVANRYIESQTIDANKLVNWSERINRAIVHISENMRTTISLRKQELVLTRTGY
ncbi:MAG: hypothetical protein J6P44_02185 [Bacteroidales bacterium]|nr:hypothetical protein [Bacteroidales bacterium]